MELTIPTSGPPASARVTHLRSQLPAGVLAMGPDPVRLTWHIEPASAALHQLAYECQAVASDDVGEVLASTGTVVSAQQVAVPAPGAPLQSREVRHYRVRIQTEAGWTELSPALRVEAGLLEASDWSAKAVTLPDDPGRERPSPCPVLRRQFDVGGEVVSARMYVTSLGLHRLTLNGKLVSEDLLAPGWTAYRHRLLAETYDVTALLRADANVLVAKLGDGWYRGRLGWVPDGRRCHYGSDVGLIAQLEVELSDGRTLRIVTDEDWLAATGEIRAADLYDGSLIDLREAKPGCESPGHDTSAWHPAAVVPFDASLIEPRMAPPVRVVETISLPCIPEAGPDRLIRLDAGQNIAGFVRLQVQGQRGDRVIVRHAEVLEPDGSLHTRSLRSARATDEYILADGEVNHLEPAFTFHGFRYAEVETSARVLGVEFAAISSDTPRRGRFECSDARLTKFHENVLWSQRDNFVSVPTDCPQRDERLGWTGDAQAFAPTACTLFDAQAFWASWLIDLGLDQDDELGVPTVVPDVVLGGPPRFGRAGWADAAAMVPWAVYEAYGDAHILTRQYDSMRRHVESLRARRGADGLLGASMQFGDWLDPDAPVDRPWEAKADSRYLANAFFAHSARLVARVAALIGEHSDASVYGSLADEVSAATWAGWAAHAVTNQTAAAAALRFGLVPDDRRGDLATTLARLVREASGRVATGFLGTPLVLPALAGAGYFAEAYLMLLRTEPPSWLYQVAQGATTVWERWDAILPDGSIHPGSMTAPPEMPDAEQNDRHMLSFNHYAYGAVIDWVYRHLAGVAPDVAQPGYRHVLLAPTPVEGIDWVRAAIDTPYGLVASAWRVEDGSGLSVEVELPFGTSGTFVAPTTPASRVTLDGAAAGEVVELSPGRHSIVVSQPSVVSFHGARPTLQTTVAAR